MQSLDSVSGHGGSKTVGDLLSVKQVQSPKQLRMSRQVFAAICETIGTRRAETGGILGGNRQTGEVTHFYFDETPRQKSSVMYTPNTARLNEVRRNQWKPLDVKFLGLIHSHPPSFCRPSLGDEESANLILEALEVPYILMPIVTTAADTGSFSLYPFAAVLDGGKVRIIEQELVVGGSLIRPAKPAKPAMAEEAKAYLAIIIDMELSLNSLWYDSLPWMERQSPYQREYPYRRSGRFDDEYD